MPQSTISARLLPASNPLPLSIAKTVFVSATLANGIVTAVDGLSFGHRGTAMSKKFCFYETTEREITRLLSRDGIYLWWAEVNRSQPVGSTWSTSGSHYYSHPRKGGAVIAVRVGNRARYLEISIPQ